MVLHFHFHMDNNNDNNSVHDNSDTDTHSILHRYKGKCYSLLHGEFEDIEEFVFAASIQILHQVYIH